MRIRFVICFTRFPRMPPFNIFKRETTRWLETFFQCLTVVVLWGSQLLVYYFKNEIFFLISLTLQKGKRIISTWKQKQVSQTCGSWKNFKRVLLLSLCSSRKALDEEVCQRRRRRPKGRMGPLCTTTTKNSKRRAFQTNCLLAAGFGPEVAAAAAAVSMLLIYLQTTFSGFGLGSLGSTRTMIPIRRGVRAKGGKVFLDGTVKGCWVVLIFC